MTTILPPITGDIVQDSWNQQVTEALNRQVALQGGVTTVVSAGGSSGGGGGGSSNEYTATLVLYTLTDTSSTPTDISTNLEYVYTTGVLRDPDNLDDTTFDGWQLTPPSKDADQYLWNIRVHIADESDTETINSTSWSAPAILIPASIETGGAAADVNAGSTKIAGASIVDSDITSNLIQGRAVIQSKIAVGAVDSEILATNSVVLGKIKDGAVDTDAIVANSITSAKIQTGAVVADKIFANAVTATKINASAVTADKIDTNAVTAAKINANAVTAAKINANAVNASKINPTFGTLQFGDTETNVLESGNFDSGSAGWQIKGNGDAEFSNVTIRGESSVDSSTIGGTADVDMFDIDADVNMVAGQIGDGITEKGLSKSNLKSWGSGTWNTPRFNGSSPQAATGSGQWTRFSSGNLYLDATPSSGTNYNYTAGLNAVPYQNYLAEITQGGTDRGWWFCPANLSTPSNGYEMVIFSTYAQDDSSSFGTTGSFVVNYYGAIDNLSKDSQHVTQWRTSVDGTVSFDEADVSFSVFGGIHSSDTTPDSSIDFTLSTSVKFSIRNEANDSEVDSVTTTTRTLTVTNNAITTDTADRFRKVGTRSYNYDYYKDIDFSDLVDIKAGQIVRVSCDLSISNTNSNFPGFNSVGTDGNPRVTTSSGQSISDVSTFIAGKSDEYAAEILGGLGTFIHSQKIFEGEDEIPTDDKLILVPGTFGALFLANVRWDVSSPSTTSVNTASCFLYSPRERYVLNDSNTQARDDGTMDTFALKGTEVRDDDGNWVCSFWIGSQTDGLNPFLYGKSSSSYNVYLTDLWDLHRIE